MTMLADASNAAGALGGAAVLILLLGGIVLAVCWIIFPFVVANGMGRIEKLLKKQNEALVRIAERQNETNRALQFLVDKK
jgi:hypothetical protein